MPKISLEEYGKEYTKTMIETADKLGPNSLMGQACLTRGNHVMDFIEAWREYCKKK